MAKKKGIFGAIKTGKKVYKAVSKPLKYLDKHPAKPGGWLKQK